MAEISAAPSPTLVAAGTHVSIYVAMPRTVGPAARPVGPTRCVVVVRVLMYVQIHSIVALVATFVAWARVVVGHAVSM